MTGSTATWELNSTQDITFDHPFLIVLCCDTAITISIFNISANINTKVHSQDCCKCNCPLNIYINPIYNIVMPYKS